MVAPDTCFLRQMVYGGAIFGGGGGGSLSAGLKVAEQALSAGKPRMAQLRDLPQNARLVTFSRIGTVSGKQGVDNLDREEARALQVFLKSYGRSIHGIIPSEVGPLAATYGLKVSALTGIPVVDAPCNGRAHPLAVMGSLGLHRYPEHKTWTVGVGGMSTSGRYLEIAMRSNVTNADQIVRNAVARMGVAFACVRNPLPLFYVARHAATGGLGIAQRLGKEFLRALKRGVNSAVAAVVRALWGKVLAEGSVQSAVLNENKGYSLGHIHILSHHGDLITIPVCNEYMMALQSGQILAAFPDLIAIFDQETALPLASGEVRPGKQVAVLAVPHKNLRLATTMRDHSLLRPIEKLLKIKFPVREIIEKSRGKCC